jgi:hypothetical protein
VGRCDASGIASIRIDGKTFLSLLGSAKHGNFSAHI